MPLEFLAKGLLIGFAIAAPVGPIGVLTIRRTLAQGWRCGFATGLGAATADAVYGAVAAFGLTLVTAVMVEQRAWLQLVGGIFLLVLGVRTVLAPLAQESGAAPVGGLIRAFASSLVLTLTNPMTILSFVAVFAGAGLGSAAHDWLGAATMVAGVFGGSAAWWLVLSGAVSGMRRRLSALALTWVNRVSGALLAGFGAWALGSLLIAQGNL